MSKDNRLVKFENLAVSNSLLIQAIIRVLVKHGLVTADEVLKIVDGVESDMDKEIRKLARDN